MAKPVFGTCHICGVHGKLSYEHVPPEAAFNNRRILHTDFEKVLRSENLDKLPGRPQQRGAGAYTLCERCNYSRIFPAHVRVYAFYTFSDRSRVAGMTGLMRGLDGTNSYRFHS